MFAKVNSTIQKKMSSKDNFKSPPWNFSWVVKNELCASAWPQTRANVMFLKDEGVKHLVTLSEEMIPHSSAKSVFSCKLIPVEEFEAPSMKDIEKFISICEKARKASEAVCVHCRMGRGRTGVMLACYFVKFYNQPPQTAITNIRLMRPGSVETHEQARSVKDYWDYLAYKNQGD